MEARHDSGRFRVVQLSPNVRENVPEELKDRRQWVCWRLVPREDGELAKVPVSPATGQDIDHLHPRNWRTFETALRSLGSDYTDGIAFVFSEDDPFVGVDLDDVLDPETGEIEPWASEIIQALSSYTEFSFSGSGLHVITRGGLPGSRNRSGKVEVYDRDRYFVATGKHMSGTPKEPQGRQEALDAVYRAYVASVGAEDPSGGLSEPVSPPMEDDAVIEKIVGSKQAEKFRRLFDDGDMEEYDDDHSRADGALCSILGFWTQDAEQIDRLFRRSALMREKWNRADYRERTIRFALQEDRDYYGAEREYPAIVLVEDVEDGEDNGRDTGDTVTLPRREGPTPTADAGDTGDTVTLAYREVRSPLGVPPFPVRALSPTLERFVLEAAHAKECPPDFVALPVLAALGVAIGASRRVEISRTYHEPPIIWTAVVAPPASGKTPAEDAALLPVIHQQRIYNHQHELALKEHEEKYRDWEQEANEARRKKKRVPPEPEKPVKKRIRVGDTTLEALMLRLVQNPRGLILTRDELAGFFNSMNQYRQKGADREVWLSLHSGKAPPLDRKSADESHDIDYPSVSMCGGIQPGKLKVLDIEAGDGMVERFLFAWPEATLLPEAERDISLEAERGYREVWERLHALDMDEDGFGKPAPKSVPLAPAAQEAYRAYKRALKEESYRPGVSEFMQGVLGKMVIYLARFSLILALVRVAESDGGASEEIIAEDVDAAYELVRYFASHASRLQTEVQEEDKKATLARALGELLEECGGTWKGSATELQEKLKAMGYGRLLPKTPDNLTPQVMSACRRTPALMAERGRDRNEGRWIEIRWARPVGGGDRS